MVHVLGANNSIFNQYISEIRDVNVQKDSMVPAKSVKYIT